MDPFIRGMIVGVLVCFIADIAVGRWIKHFLNNIVEKVSMSIYRKGLRAGVMVSIGSKFHDVFSCLPEVTLSQLRVESAGFVLVDSNGKPTALKKWLSPRSMVDGDVLNIHI